jgi:hypothetical protein
MSDIADVRTEIAEVRAAIGWAEVRLINWIIGTGFVAVLVLSAQLWGAVALLLQAVAHG